MPRFSLKTMLIAVAVVAFWLATLTDGGYECRRCMAFVIVMASGVAFICYRGRKQVFWGSFFIAMLLLGIGDVFRSYPHLPSAFNIASTSLAALSTTVELSDKARLSVYHSILTLFPLVLSILVGFIATYIYDQSRKTDDK